MNLLTSRPAGFALALAALLLVPSHSEACSMLTLRDGDTVLVGNNEDWKEPGYIWFVPGKKGRYGRVNVGFKNLFAQGSLNEKGLVFDAAVVPDVPWQEDPAKPTPDNLLEKIMDEAETVAQAIEYFEKFNCPHLRRSQFLFADATGDSAVISWRDGALSVTPIDGAFQIATNTRLEGTEYRCQRHTRAQRELSGASVSPASVAATLDALHQVGPYFTTYSTIYDLRVGTVTIYNLANFDEAVTFELAAELRKGKKTYRLAKLFEQSPDIDDVQRASPRRDFGTRVELGREVLERYEGVYSPEKDVRVRVLRDGGELRLITAEKPKAENEARLFPESDRLFRIAPDHGQVSFDLSPDGQVKGLILHRQVDVYAERIEDD